MNTTENKYIIDLTGEQFKDLAMNGTNFVSVYYNLQSNQEKQIQWLQDIDEIAEEYKDRILFTKLNCQHNHQYCKYLKVKAYPNTTMLSPITDEMFIYFNYTYGKQNFKNWVENMHKRPFVLRRSAQQLLQQLNGDISEQQIVITTSNFNIPPQYYQIGRKYTDATVYVLVNTQSKDQQAIQQSDLFEDQIKWQNINVFVCQDQKCNNIEYNDYNQLIQLLDQIIE